MDARPRLFAPWGSSVCLLTLESWGALWSHENSKKGHIERINKLVKAVEQININGECVNVFLSLSEAEEKTNVLACNISRVCNGIRDTAGGFVWRYKK